jgi:hypothetical protein
VGIEKVIAAIRNPLTVIGVFALILEFGLGSGLGHADPTVQPLLVAVMALIACLTVLGFFAVLIWRPHHFYGPADFKDESNYMAASDWSQRGSTAADIWMVAYRERCKSEVA